MRPVLIPGYIIHAILGRILLLVFQQAKGRGTTWKGLEPRAYYYYVCIHHTVEHFLKDREFARMSEWAYIHATCVLISLGA